VNDRGSVTVLGLGLIAVIVVLGLMLATAGQYLAARSQIQTAADAAALAAAPVTFRPFGSGDGPAGEAARLAAANGAQLVECDCPIDRSFAVRVVEVEVTRKVSLLVLGSRDMRAVAAAEFTPIRLFLSE
jgi:secretion/DNA translocation related TadE-like protein